MTGAAPTNGSTERPLAQRLEAYRLFEAEAARRKAAKEAAPTEYEPPVEPLPMARINMANALVPRVETMVLGNCFPLAKVSVVYGPSGMGKSALMAQVAVACAAGTSVLWGLPLIDGGCPVLVYTLEDSLGDWELKLAAIHKAGGIDVEQALPRIRVIDRSEGVARFSELVTVREDTDDGQVMRRRVLPSLERRRLIASAASIGAKLILVETASRLVDDEDNAHFSALQSDLGHIARSSGAAVILSHHSTKAATREGDESLESARGGGALVYNARNALALFPAEPAQAGPYRDRWPAEDLFVLHHTKSTSSTRKQASITLVRCDGTFGAVFHRPEDAPLSPDQAAATAERMELAHQREWERLERLHSVVARALQTRPALSPNALREFRGDLGVSKHEVDRLVELALEKGVLVVRDKT